MLVERLTGRYAGKRTEIPFHIARCAIKTGAVRLANDPEVISEKVEPEAESAVIEKKRRRPRKKRR